MAREVVLDANVLVARLDATDTLAGRAQQLGERLRDEGAELVLLDILVNEAVSVLCRRARERRKAPPDLAGALATVRAWARAGAIRWVAESVETRFDSIVDVVEQSGGALNFNDALLVVLQREGTIGDVASFDQGLDVAPGFRRLV